MASRLSSLLKINAFATDPAQHWVFAGNQSGQILSVDVDGFEVRGRTSPLSAEISAVAVHPSLPYVAAVAADATAMIGRYDEAGVVTPLHHILLSRIAAENRDGYPHKVWWWLFHALAFHPTERQLVCRSGDGALCEISFDDEAWRPLWCRGYFPGDGAQPPLDVVSAFYLQDPRYVLVTALGELVIVDREHRDEPVFRYRQPGRRYPFHWAEHVEGNDYLLTNDVRRVFRLDATGRRAPIIGDVITRDHMEVLDYNPVSRRALVTSFDRRVHEVDPTTLAPMGVVVETPFKLRWLETLRRDPSILLLQCRNGSLYKLDLAHRRLAAVIRETPNALWSAVARSPQEICIAGEGPDVVHITAVDADPVTQETRFSTRWEQLPGAAHRFTKRMIVHPTTGALLLGRSDGDLIASNGVTARRIANVGSAVRDLAALPDSTDFFAVCENGRAHRVSLETGAIVASYTSPEDRAFWACAYNPDAGVLALGERHGALRLLDPERMECISATPGCASVKRMRWLDRDRLYLSQGLALASFDLRTRAIETVFDTVDNTIEDFDWDEGRRFFAFCTYQNRVELHDYETFDSLDLAYADIDYPHGLLWLSPRRAPGAFPYEFLVFGRSGVARRFRVHNNMIVALGPLHEPCEIPPEPGDGFVFAK